MSKFAGLALDVENPRRLYLAHPVTRQPLADAAGERAWVDLYSGDSSAARAHHRAVSRRRLDQPSATKLTPEEIEADGHTLLAAVTAGWFLVGLDGQPFDLPFSRETAVELYAEPGLAWLREQVNAFAGDRANFATASSGN